MSDEISSPLKVPGDVVVHVESLEYCTKTVKVRNPHNEEITLRDIAGYPLVAGTNGADYNLAMAGGEENVVAILMDGPIGQADEVIPATTNGKHQYQALVNPPAILNQDKIALVDVDGAEFDQAAIRTAMRALGFEFRPEPTNIEIL